MSLPAQERPPARIRIGRVVGAHGLHGALRLRPDNPASEILAGLGRIYLEPGDGPVRELRVVEARRLNAATIRLKCDGLDDAAAAAALRGAVVAVAVDDLPPSAPGEFYYYQAIGCAVITTAGLRLGVIEEVFGTGANDVWVVRGGEREVLVPVIASVVKAIDLAARTMLIEAVPGLLE